MRRRCALRVSSLQLTDAVLTQFEMRAARLAHRASDVAHEPKRRTATEVRASLEQIRKLVEDESIDLSLAAVKLLVPGAALDSIAATGEV